MVFGNNHAYQRGQEDQSKILTDHFLYFLSIGVVVVPKGRSKRHLEAFCERLSSDPSTKRGHRRFLRIMAIFPFFAQQPLNHSTARYDPGKALRDPYAQK